MRISIIIPAYNCVGTIEKTIESIRLSGLSDYEIIIVDDGSKDGTGEVCDMLSQKHDGICCFHQNNAGVSAARNRGIKEATGEYVMFCDADDSIAEKSLAYAVERLNCNKPDMLLFGESFDYYRNGKRYRSDELFFPEERCMYPEQWGKKLGELYLCNALSPVWNKLIKRSIIIDNNIQFDGKVFEMEDFLFSIDCLRHCETVYNLPKVVYRYKQAEDERATYNRLRRVDSLTAYMKPFEEKMEKLYSELKEKNIETENGSEIVENIYAMLFHEQIRFANTERIKAAGKDMLNGKYAVVIKKKYPTLFDEMEKGHYAKIHFQKLKSRFRHYVAVRYKVLRSN